MVCFAYEACATVGVCYKRVFAWASVWEYEVLSRELVERQGLLGVGRVWDALGYDVLEVKGGFEFQVRGLFCGEVGPEYFGCTVVGGDRVLPPPWEVERGVGRGGGEVAEGVRSVDAERPRVCGGEVTDGAVSIFMHDDVADSVGVRAAVQFAGTTCPG